MSSRFSAPTDRLRTTRSTGDMPTISPARARGGSDISSLRRLSKCDHATIVRGGNGRCIRLRDGFPVRLGMAMVVAGWLPLLATVLVRPKCDHNSLGDNRLDDHSGRRLLAGGGDPEEAGERSIERT